jgi:hypothetical protein
MKFTLKYTTIAASQLVDLNNDLSKHRILKDVLKALGYMETNLRHPSLNTHEYHSLKGPQGEKVFEAYAQQKTSGAYRIFWYYGPGKNVISIIAILAHP